MTTIIYILIGIFLAFLFVLINKIIEKYQYKKFIKCIQWLQVDDEIWLAFTCILIIIIWPILLGLIGAGILFLGMITLFYLIGSNIYKVFNWICNKIIKQ